ncbi:hypothetical protein [Streptomyces ardesiacus]|uniref:hypothetical protein n=1 Tax=Streptomyces ardesiacus TaxID=285564 RepID=UPI0036A5E426
MSTEGQLPASQRPDEDPMLSVGRYVASQWNTLPPEHLAAAMRAMEPELRRAHRERMARMELQHDADARRHQERQQQRQHRRYMAGLFGGGALSLAMLGGGVYVAADAWWLATLLCGPSLLAIAKVFVLRRSDPDDMRLVARTARSSTSAASQAQPPPPPV